jgi:hypothetical protein
MELESVTLKLPRELLSGAQRVATAQEVTIGHMVRQLLKREVDRQLSSKDITTVSGGLISAVQALLERDVADACNWDDLSHRLRPHGYVFRLNEGALVLFKTSCGTRICRGSELGFSYANLVKRFGQQMPEQPVSNVANGVMPAGRLDRARHTMLNKHFAAARNWPDLINRLAIEGMELRPLGAGLGIHIVATGRHLCNSGTLGVRYQTLVTRFGTALPGHPVDLSAGQDTRSARF